MLYTQEKTSEISFPLGGIGSGCIGLGGNGLLIDWEIFNRPAKHSRNGLTFFAVRAEEGGKVSDFRILNGDHPMPYTGLFPEQDGNPGYGYGCEATSMAGWPHFTTHTFNGTYPTAEIDFGDEEFPLHCALTGWSVMIPGESRDSSLPAAIIEVEAENPTDRVIDCTVLGVLENPWTWRNMTRYNEIAGSQLTTYSGDNIGDVTLTMHAPNGAQTSHQTNLYRGFWMDCQEMFYNDLMRGGLFKERCYEDRVSKTKVHEAGLLAAHFALKPGEKKRTSFIITWNIPVYEHYWASDDDKKRAEAAGLPLHWRNYYATQWRDSRDSGDYVLRNYERLRAGTFAFRDALFAGNLPEVVKDAVSSCLSVLKSPTCLRLEDGTFYGWEGVSPTEGSCEGSCTHVWNYAQALPFLFPDLERSMHAAQFKYGVDDLGASHFRLKLPLGIHATREDFRPCADGQFGDVMKFYRDWKLSGDDAYLRQWWPTVRKTIEFAWSPENADCWDPEQQGVLIGRQHNTLDVELFGPNAWLTGHYLGALDAAARMADYLGEHDFAQKCHEIRARGYKWIDEHLFNGEYFYQQVDLTDKAMLEKFDSLNYWNDEAKEIIYQIADGCGIDATLAQNYAALYGLDRIFDCEKQHATLKSILRYNFRSNLRHHINIWRNYSVNDESGVCICTWPHHNKPAVPMTYNTETMTGFEWAFASQLISEGMIDDGLKVATAIRQRFDGQRRNPWNEFECGNNYARSMAAFGLLPALLGFRYDAGAGMIGFSPKVANLSCFWALGELWGNFIQNDNHIRIEIKHGSFLLKQLAMDGNVRVLQHNDAPATLPLQLHAGDTIELDM